MTVTFLNLAARSSEPRTRTFADEGAYVAWLNEVAAMVEIVATVAA